MAAEPGIPRELGPAPLAGGRSSRSPATGLCVCRSWSPGARTPRRHPLPGTCLTVGRGVEPTGSHLLPPSRPRLPVPGSGV